MEASITVTAFHLQGFRFLPHAVEVFALLGYLHCKSIPETASTSCLLTTHRTLLTAVMCGRKMVAKEI